MATEEQMPASKIGGIHLHNAPFGWQSSAPALPARSAADPHGSSAKASLGLACRVDVGSKTRRKPIIDMVLALADFADKPARLPAIGVAAYALRIRESDCYEHRFLRGPDANFKLFLARTSCNRPAALIPRLARSNDADRDLYERTKRELAKRTWKYVRIQRRQKTSFVEENQRACPRRPIFAAEITTNPCGSPPTFTALRLCTVAILAADVRWPSQNLVDRRTTSGFARARGLADARAW